MTSQFIGLTILLTLNDPSHTQLRGLVAEVIGQELTLHNVLFVSSGYTVPSYIVNGLNIHDIEISSELMPAPPPPLPPPLVPAPTYVPVQHALHALPPVTHTPPVAPAPASHMYQSSQPLAHPHSQSLPYPANIVNSGQNPAPVAPELVDPAIVSMSRKPMAPTTVQAPPPQHIPQSLEYSTPPRISAILTATNAPAVARASNGGLLKQQGSSHGSNISLNTLGMSTAPKTQAYPMNTTVESLRLSSGLTQSQPRAPPPATTLSLAFADLALKTDPAESSTFDETDDNLSSMALPPTPEVRQKSTGKRSRRGKSHLKRVHEQRQLLESIPHEHRNVVVAPGMFSGSIAATANTHASVFVQPGMSRRKKTRWGNRYDGNTTNAEEEGWATEDVNDYKEREFDFQGNLERFDKKTVFSQLKAEDTTADGDRLVSFNRLPQRTSSGKLAATTKKNYHHHENVLGNYANGKSLVERDGWNSTEFIAEESESSDDSDRHTRGRGDGGTADSGRSSRHTMSRQASRRRSTRNIPAARSLENLHYTHSSSGGGIKPTKASLRITPSLNPCPIVSPLQMLDVERIAEVELGLTDDMMTENAARGIAQVAISAFGKRISASNHNALPVVLVLAGNHKSGARAIAAGRHLKNHHVRVMVCVLGLEREDELLEAVRRQLAIFRNAGGRVARWEDVAPGLGALDAPAELVIDGLLGTHLGWEDLRRDQQKIVWEAVRWANSCKAGVLAVDIPSGVDGSTGQVAQLEDTGPLHMRAKWVVCMGAPKSGLLNALVSGVGAGWNLYVADIGISNTAWRKYGTRRRHGVEFAAEWVVGLEYHGGSS